MEKEFVTYEQALALKELGFDEDCLAFYWNTGKFYTTAEYPHSIEYHKQNQLGDYNYDSTSAPTYSQAFRWFREKYQYMGIVLPFGDNLFDYRIYSSDKGEHLIGSTEYNTYEETEITCLTKLIQIVKENK